MIFRPNSIPKNRPWRTSTSDNDVRSLDTGAARIGHGNCHLRNPLRFNGTKLPRWQPQPHLHMPISCSLLGLSTTWASSFLGRTFCPSPQCNFRRHATCFCTSGSNSLEHASLDCTAHHSARQCWLQQSNGACPLSMQQSFDTSAYVNMLVTLPATSRILHAFAKPLRRATYEHFLRASA